MKLSLFTSKEEFAEYANRQADLIEQHGLKYYREMLETAIDGVGKEDWIKMNHIPADRQESEWAEHIEWIRDSVKHLETKVRKYRRDAKKALA